MQIKGAGALEGDGAGPETTGLGTSQAARASVETATPALVGPGKVAS